MVNDLAFRRWLFALALCALAVVACVYYCDRPLAEIFDTCVQHSEISDWLKGLLAPLVLIPMAALVFQFGAGCWVLSGRQLNAWTQKTLLCSWSTTWALAAEFVCKRIFGRGWPDPTYIENHLYGFRFLHGTQHWNSFPSGTATISAAIAATIWLIAPRLRLPAVLLAALLCVGVVVTNGHWLSDVIAGAFLGASIGWMTVSLLGARVWSISAGNSPVRGFRPHSGG